VPQYAIIVGIQLAHRVIKLKLVQSLNRKSMLMSAAFRSCAGSQTRADGETVTEWSGHEKRYGSNQQYRG
jgi:hypothetical protein